MEKGIIKLFKAGINYSKLNLLQIGLGIWLRKLSQRREINDSHFSNAKGNGEIMGNIPVQADSNM